jgi:signal transduction histidine kinase
MRSQRTGVVVVGVVAAVVLLVALLAPEGGRVKYPVAVVLLTLLTSTSFIVVGLIANRRSREDRVAWVMIAAGFAAIPIGLQSTDMRVPLTVGVLASHLMPVLIGHLLMIYPSGRFESKFQRIVISLGYVDALLLAWPAIFVLAFQLECESCGANPLLVRADEQMFNAISAGRLTIDALLVIGLAIALTQRWYASVPTRRSVLAPVIWSGGLTIAIFALTFVSAIAGASEELVRNLNLAILSLSLSIPCSVAYGLVHSRFTRAGAVSDLVATLARGESLEEDLRDVLARALQDPTLELAYWLPDRKHFVDSGGQPVESPHAHSRRRWQTVNSNGEMIAAIIYDDTMGDQTRLVEAAAGAAALSLENKRLEAELRAHVKDLEASRVRLVEATDAERQRFERDLHDGAQQQLLAIAMRLNRARSKLPDDPEGASELFERAVLALTDATVELRKIARGLHPANLSSDGLAGALLGLVDRSPVPAEIISVPQGRLPEQIEATVYFLVAEALTNAARHSKAMHVTVAVAERDDLIHLEVRDDGVGGADVDTGSGLAGLVERVSAFGGTLTVVSPEGAGTILTAALPRTAAASDLTTHSSD